MAKHDLLGIRGMASDEIYEILEAAESFREIAERPVKKVPTLRGRTIVNLFFEPSTRTRASFEIAGKRMSADVVNFSPKSSSLSKQESILDTARTIDAMDPDAVVVRHDRAEHDDRITRCQTLANQAAVPRYHRDLLQHVLLALDHHVVSHPATQKGLPQLGVIGDDVHLGCAFPRS